ncbi:hypothetical protein [Nocardiopsis sp. NRRL B-16309]|uniref:hypothetical protein n=1 Tax=Nocardiopsis sp. NRRL B-16309 TaxID=1519494 RepID=UPI0006AD8A2D|nr:hypothetical protein [Nocardiopsis sp. NRRL B-16309]KOX11847.1 hypothetical protein ADL05_23095 [Nocardiopsis sp. NRRL B-16309]
MPTDYTRVVTFERIGLHTDIEPLTVKAYNEFDFRHQIYFRAVQFLAPTTEFKVDAHPDVVDGSLYAVDSPGGRGPLLGSLTVSLPQPEGAA